MHSNHVTLARVQRSEGGYDDTSMERTIAMARTSQNELGGMDRATSHYPDVPSPHRFVQRGRATTTWPRWAHFAGSLGIGGSIYCLIRMLTSLSSRLFLTT